MKQLLLNLKYGKKNIIFKQFFCPLCKVERKLEYRSKLSVRQYFQILLIYMFISLFTFSSMGVYSIVFLFLTWSIFDFVNRSLFKNNIPCPHCGFDASWYKKDLKTTRTLVEKFWEDKVPSNK